MHKNYSTESNVQFFISVFFSSMHSMSKTRVILYNQMITMLRLLYINVHIHSIYLLYKQALHILHVYPSLVCSGTLLIQGTWPAPPQRWHEACTVPIIPLHSLQVRQYTHFLKFLTKVCVFLDSSLQFKCVLTGHLVFLHIIMYNLSVGFAGCLQKWQTLLSGLFFWFSL